MGTFGIVFISAVLITELHFINTVPVPQLSVKLLCELLCEHCNGVSNMESGHCNCEVPEAHFKDNSPCLERVQISAAEMNLKLTHFKNSRRERSVSDLLGRINSKVVEDAEINYSQGYNKLSDESLTPPTPNPVDVNKSEYPTPDHQELFVKRSINNVPDPEFKKENGYLEQSPENESFRKRSKNYFQTTSMDALYGKKLRTTMPSPRIFSGSNLRSEKLSLIYPRREKRSYTKRVQFTRNEDGKILHREVTNSNENYDLIVNVQADISIPALKAKPADNENIVNLKLQVNDDSESQVSPPQVADGSFVMKSEQSTLKKNSVEEVLGKIKSLGTITPTDVTTNTKDAVVSNKFRSSVNQQILDSSESDASKPTNLIDDSNSLLLESKFGLPSLASLKLPMLSRCKLLRSSNKNKLLQINKLNELKSRFENLLSRGQPRIPLSELLKGPKSSIALAENNPLAKLVSLSSLPKCSTPLGKSKNTALDDLLTKGAVNDLKLKDQGIGMTLLERIKNNQLKLKQNLLGGKSEQYRAQNKDPSECHFENENSDLPLKLNPSDSIESNTHARTIDCEDDYNDDVASPMHSVDKSRSHLQNTESVDDEIRTDPPGTVPVSQESRSTTFIPPAFSGNSVVTTALPNEPIAHAGEIEVNNDTKHEGKENEPIAMIVQSTSEPPKEAINISPTQHPVADIRIMVNISDPKSAHNETLSYDSIDDQHLEKLQEPIVAGNVEAVPADPASVAPIAGLEAHPIQSEEISQSTSGNSMDAKKTLSNHPHFGNRHDNNLLTKTPNYFSPVFMSPPRGNNIRLSPEETYHGMFDPAAFHNDIQRMHSPPLLTGNDPSNTGQVSVLNRPVVMDPNSIIPFDHPIRLPANFNGAPHRPNLPLHNEQSGMIMRGFVPAESYSNNPANLPPSSVFILKPVLTPDGNIPFPELLNQIRTGNAVIQIYPINLNNVDNNGL